MKHQRNVPNALAMLAAGLAALVLSGCSTLGSTAADVSLAGAGGVAGYHLSDGKMGGAAAGAAVGLIGSRVTQDEVRREIKAAEERGFHRALNQAVKQHYWIIQNQQRSRENAAEPEVRLVLMPFGVS